MHLKYRRDYLLWTVKETKEIIVSVRDDIIKDWGTDAVANLLGQIFALDRLNIHEELKEEMDELIDDMIFLEGIHFEKGAVCVPPCFKLNP